MPVMTQCFLRQALPNLIDRVLYGGCLVETCNYSRCGDCKEEESKEAPQAKSLLFFEIDIFSDAINASRQVMEAS